MRKIIQKRGDIVQEYLFQILFSGLLIVLFLVATSRNIDSRDVKQQVLEKQISLLISSAKPGMSFEINKFHHKSYINEIRVSEGRVYVVVDSHISLNGYSYFSKHDVVVRETPSSFVIEVIENG